MAADKADIQANATFAEIAADAAAASESASIAAFLAAAEAMNIATNGLKGGWHYLRKSLYI